ncbi:MAG: hypothetical protein HN348_36790, partial [Proteobacteria bacterium]|nr:hypothetical protein [Pseudomonadota bacterium]
MIPCTSCNRHIKSSETTCPFCGTHHVPPPRSKALASLNSAVAIVLTPFILAACYGAMPEVDNDGDGWNQGPDCDDRVAAINPDADEV